MRARSVGPWVDDVYSEAFEILGVARRKGQLVSDGGSGNQAVHGGEPASTSLGKSHKITPGQGDRRFDRNNPVFEALRQIVRDPFIQGVALSPTIYQRDTAADLCNRDDTDERAVSASS
jgi:hypothetical protein